MTRRARRMLSRVQPPFGRWWQVPLNTYSRQDRGTNCCELFADLIAVTYMRPWSPLAPLWHESVAASPSPPLPPIKVRRRQWLAPFPLWMTDPRSRRRLQRELTAFLSYFYKTLPGGGILKCLEVPIENRAAVILGFKFWRFSSYALNLKFKVKIKI